MLSIAETTSVKRGPVWALLAVLVALVVGLGPPTHAKAWAPPPVPVVLPASAGLSVTGPIAGVVGAFVSGFWFGNQVLGPLIFGQPAGQVTTVGTGLSTVWTSTPVAHSAPSTTTMQWETAAPRPGGTGWPCFYAVVGFANGSSSSFPTSVSYDGAITTLSISRSFNQILGEYRYTKIYYQQAGVYNDGGPGNYACQGMTLTDPPVLTHAISTTLTVTTQCVNAAGQTYQASRTVPYVYGSGASVDLGPGGCGTLSDGVRSGWQITDTRPTGAVPVLTVTPWSAAAAEAMPACTVAAAGGTAVCTVRLFYENVVCAQAGGTPCAGWWTEQGTEGFECFWGPVGSPKLYSLPISDCQSAFPDRTFDPTLNPDQNPNPNPGGQVWPEGGKNIDPETGLPTTATGGPAPDATDQSALECIGAEWSWNPVSWVYAPVKCAFRWAFVPPVNPLDGWGAEIGAALPTMPDLDVETTGACGIPLTVPEVIGGGFTFNLLPVCPGEAGHGAANVLRIANIAVVTLLFTVSTVGTITWALGWANPLARLTWYSNGERALP